MSNILEIVRGISQVLASKHDGATDEKGQKIKLGLERDKNGVNNIPDLMDGFGVKFMGDKLCITYHAEVNMKDMHNKDFQYDVETKYKQIQSFIEKEYKKHTKKSLKLNPLGDADILVQSMSRIRNWIQCTKHYSIGTVKLQEQVSYEELFRGFLNGKED